MTVSAPNSSWVVINIGGVNSTLSGMNMILQDISQQKVLFNFYESESLVLQSINVLGSILAPQANVEFTYGQITGSIVCSSLVGSGGVSYNPWIPFTPPCHTCSC